MEHVEQISIQVQQLKKKLAWSWVYDVDKKLEEQNVRIEKLKNRVPTCQAKIDKQLVCMPTLSSHSEVFICQHKVKFSAWFKNGHMYSKLGASSRTKLRVLKKYW